MGCLNLNTSEIYSNSNEATKQLQRKPRKYSTGLKPMTSAILLKPQNMWVFFATDCEDHFPSILYLQCSTHVYRDSARPVYAGFYR